MNKFKLNVNIIFALLFCVMIFVYLFNCTVALDPDFGWRLVSGQMTLREGIPKVDPFSYTMPSFPYVDHSWLVSVGIALLYPTVGKIGLAIVVVGLTFLALLISSYRFKYRQKGEFQNLPYLKAGRVWFIRNSVFLLSYSVLLFFVGVRAQIVTWFMISVLSFVVFEEELWEKWKWYLPLFFVVWANFHGGYASGLALLGLVVLAKTIRLRKIEPIDFLLVFLSVVATLLNPYGIGSWREIWSSVADSSLRWSIVEWMPSIFVVDFSMAALLAISGVFVFVYRKKFKLEEIVVYAVFLVQAISSRRHLPLWIIISLPITTEAIYYLYKAASQKKFGIERFNLAYKFIWIGSLVLLALQVYLSTGGARGLSEDAFYPKSAVSYLKQNPKSGEVFSDYGWGGYLIWKYPEKKIFIDGRMPSWKWAPPNDRESGYVFDDYKKIFSGEIDYQQIFQKYNIDTVLLPKERPLGPVARFEKRIQIYVNKLRGKNKTEFDLYKKLKDDGWREIYSDKISVILRKV